MFNSLICLGQATEATGGAQQGPSMMPMLIIFGIMIFWMFRSQKKEKAKREQLLASVKAGDEIITAGGIMAEVVSVKDTTYIVKIAEKVNVEISKNGIGTVVREEEKEEAK